MSSAADARLILRYFGRLLPKGLPGPGPAQSVVDSNTTPVSNGLNVQVNETISFATDAQKEQEPKKVAQKPSARNLMANGERLSAFELQRFGAPVHSRVVQASMSVSRA